MKMYKLRTCLLYLLSSRNVHFMENVDRSDRIWIEFEKEHKVLATWQGF